jgi:hypothetical protein
MRDLIHWLVETLKTSLLFKKEIRLPDSSSSNKRKPASNTRQQEERSVCSCELEHLRVKYY